MSHLGRKGPRNLDLVPHMQLPATIRRISRALRVARIFRIRTTACDLVIPPSFTSRSLAPVDWTGTKWWHTEPSEYAFANSTNQSEQ